MAVKTGNPETDKMFRELSHSIQSMLTIPNELVPDQRLCDKRSNETTLAHINRKHKKFYDAGPTEHELLKAEKAKRVEKYGRDVDNDQPIQYNEDEMRLYRAELAFASMLVKMGVIDFDDE